MELINARQFVCTNVMFNVRYFKVNNLNRVQCKCHTHDCKGDSRKMYVCALADPEGEGGPPSPYPPKFEAQDIQI